MKQASAPHIILKELTVADLDVFEESFKGTYLSNRLNLFKKYLKEHTEKIRYVQLACCEKKIVGYVTLKYVSDYEYFAKNNIPEIVDFNVVPRFRKQGIGRKLLQQAETVAKESGYVQIGIGVGLYKDYGNAQRLYVKTGYIPDGEGLCYDGKPVEKETQTTVDDALALYFTKQLR